MYTKVTGTKVLCFMNLTRLGKSCLFSNKQRVFDDNLVIVFHISAQKWGVVSLMNIHNICFYGQLKKIILLLSNTHFCFADFSLTVESLLSLVIILHQSFILHGFY